MKSLEIKNIVPGEDQKSIVIMFSEGESCTVAGMSLKMLSDVFKELIACHSGCGTTNWKPMPSPNIDTPNNSFKII